MRRDLRRGERNNNFARGLLVYLVDIAATIPCRLNRPSLKPWRNPALGRENQPVVLPAQYQGSGEKPRRTWAFSARSARGRMVVGKGGGVPHKIRTHASGLEIFCDSQFTTIPGLPADRLRHGIAHSDPFRSSAFRKICAPDVPHDGRRSARATAVHR